MLRQCFSCGDSAGQDKRLAFVDALRGLAILGVMFTHSSQVVSDGSGILWSLAGNGARGVQLFYLVSAFTLSYVMHFVYKQDSSWLHFFVRRFFRIAPMYYTAILACLAVYFLGSSTGVWHPIIAAHVYWTAGADTPSLGSIISNFGFFHGINPYWITSLVPGGWSITVEATFYTLFSSVVLVRVYWPASALPCSYLRFNSRHHDFNVSQCTNCELGSTLGRVSVLVVP